MVVVALILCYLTGCSVLMFISRRFSLLQILGYSFLIGIGIETVFLWGLDIVQLHYSQLLLVALNLVVIIFLNRGFAETMEAFKEKIQALKISAAGINYVALFLFCIIAYLFYAITVKNLFWPPAETDSITSFDKLARIMVMEGKLKISLFEYNLQGAAGVYPPLFHGSMAYVYIFGAETPKIVITLYFLSLLLVFYSFVKMYTHATAAMLFTLILMATPELYAHAALGLGNMPTSAYVCAAALALYVWLDQNDESYFWLATITMSFVVFIRSDCIAFVAAALLVILVRAVKAKSYRHLFIYTAGTVGTFLAWLLCVKLKIQLPQASRFDMAIGINGARLNTIFHYIKAYLLAVSYNEVQGGQLYGVVFVAFILALLVNAGLAFRKGAKAVFGNQTLLLLFLLVSFVLYTTEYYLINEKVQASTVASLMASSFKRGMFYFIPVVLFYTLTSYAGRGFFSRLEKFRTGG